MSEDQEAPKDVLGLAPFGKAVQSVSEGVVKGAEAFLGRICLPAAEEFGLLLRDKVSAWRAANAVKTAQKAERLLSIGPGIEGKHAHPRIVAATLEGGSWTEADDVQDMWGGLLASSCTDDGRDESNLIFINILSQLTTAQARILKHVCEHAEKIAHASGLITAGSLYLTAEEALNIFGIADIHRLDRELDHLYSVGLITTPFNLSYPQLVANLAPTALALNLYVRCQGSNESPPKYFGLAIPSEHKEMPP